MGHQFQKRDRGSEKRLRICGLLLLSGIPKNIVEVFGREGGEADWGTGST